jgi:hypothetical protein
MGAAALLEVLQSLTPNHSPNFLAALTGVGGALAAALLTKLIKTRRISALQQRGEPQVSLLAQTKQL